MDILLVDDPAPARSRDDERSGGDVIDATRDAACSVEDRVNSPFVEYRIFARSSTLEAAREIIAGLVEAQWRKSCEGGDALVQGMVGRFSEAIVETRMTGEQE